jgi:integrase
LEKSLTLIHRPTGILTIPPDLGGPVMRDGLTQAEYKAFRDAMPTWRDRLICMALRNTGLRINELLSIEKHETSFTRSTGGEGPTYVLFVQRLKKRDKAAFETIYISPDLGVQIADWIRVHKIKPTDRIFGQRDRQYNPAKISDRGVRHCFAKYGLQTLGRPIMPKEFRRLFIQDLIDGGVPIELASRMIGHENTRTTQEHYYHPTQERRRFIGERIEV